MRHWRVRFDRRGWEPPYPFGKTESVVCTPTRETAKATVPTSPRFPVTASQTTDPVDFPFQCTCGGRPR